MLRKAGDDFYPESKIVSGGISKLWLYDTEAEHDGVNIICFSVLSRFEFRNIQFDEKRRSSWARVGGRLRPTILVGMDIEQRSNPEEVHRLLQEQPLSGGLYEGRVGPVLPEEGEMIAQEIGAAKYMECSLADKEQVKAIFHEVRRKDITLYEIVNTHAAFGVRKASRLAVRDGSRWYRAMKRIEIYVEGWPTVRHRTFGHHGSIRQSSVKSLSSGRYNCVIIL